MCIFQLFVAVRLHCFIAVFSLDGTFLRCFGEMGSAPGQFMYPAGICHHWVGANRELYVCDRHNKRMQVLDPVAGACRRMWKCGGFSPNSVLVSPSSGEVIVGSYHQDGIFVFQPSGMLLRVLKSVDYVLNCLLTSSDTLLVCSRYKDHVVEIRCSDGEKVRNVVRVWHDGESRVGRHAEAVAVDEEGRMFVCDSYCEGVSLFW